MFSPINTKILVILASGEVDMPSESQTGKKGKTGLPSSGSFGCGDIAVCDMLKSLSLSAAKSDSQHEVHAVMPTDAADNPQTSLMVMLSAEDFAPLL